MRISTKTLASLLLVTAVTTAVPKLGKQRRASQFDRLLQRHDRKCELRAELLGLTPLQFRDLQKRKSFDEIIRKSGFSNERAFRLALLGKLKSELHHRGWTMQRIERYVAVRSPRLG